MKFSVIPEDASIALKVLLANEEHVSPGSCFGPVIRSIYIIECCTEGRGSVIINGKEFPVKAGDSYVLLPGDAVRHTADTSDPRGGYYCAVCGTAADYSIKEAGITSTSPFVSAAAFHEIRSWMEQLVHQWPRKDTGAQLRQIGCAYGLLGVILGNRHSAEKSTLIDRAIGYIEHNYPNELTVAEIAKAVGLEQSYLSVLFKNRTGYSPYKYLTRLRVQKSCQLMLTGKYGIAAVADLVGLDPHNFARIFYREMGMSPSDFMQASTPDKLPPNFLD